MKRTAITLLTTLLIANGFAASSAMAATGDNQGGQVIPHPQNGQPQGHGPQQGPGNGPDHQGNGQNRPQQGGNRGGHDEPHGQQGGDRGRGEPHGQQAERFAYHGNDFRRGHAAPKNFRGDKYRVNDWRARGLSQPPQGHYWAAINGNYVLMAATTGIITSIIMNSALPR
ncbi:RcnB family protein [Tatumella sp. JGM118]|uniref:RcnB family protein n=1 Tax=Tatumella sp. JGM118 TaxID=2799796 RepID=UPI001BAF605D|nr:RcnB family protein [Tatumella sp. JGM118]MBS0910465.1 RcnB family protein [Tatumella sp. JGM118]